MRVIAGAGTGKTRALVSRYCYLVSTLGIAPKNILCVTFTNRAANEMKRRVRSMLGDMGLTMRETTIQRTIDEVLEAKKMQATSYIAEIYELDNEQLKEKYLRAANRNEAIFLRYLYEQKKCFGLDFNDLINFATYILEKFPDVREKWQDRMQYVMVDEFQDVSKRQYTIAQILSGRHGNLFIVGDPDQTIYSWRGSHVKLFLDFDKVYPAAKTVTLSVNYRSTPEILLAANTLIAKNVVRYPKKLSPTKKSGSRPLYNHTKSDQDEAKWIFEEINRLRDWYSAGRYLEAKC